MSISFKRRFYLLCLLLAPAISSVCASPSTAEQSSLTAIDIVLKPDSVMIQRAQENNAELLKDYPHGFSLDSTHNPHITLVQRYVKSADLDKVYEAAERIVHKEKPKNWKLEAFKYYYGKMGQNRSGWYRRQNDSGLAQTAKRTDRSHETVCGTRRRRQCLCHHKRRTRHRQIYD